MSGVPTTDVEVPLPHDGVLRAAMALPDAAGPRPGVVVLHEAFGLNADIRRITARFADSGYVALAPDLYSHPGRARCLSRVLLDGFVRGASDETLADIEAARRYLAERPEVDGERIAVIGFCMGGGFALAFAPNRGLRAVSVNYGPVPRGRDALTGICPVVASYGALDRVMRDEPVTLERRLSDLGVPHDVKVYESVGHSFMSYDNAPAVLLRIPTPMRVGYSETAAEDAWHRILAFFMEHVG